MDLSSIPEYEGDYFALIYFTQSVNRLSVNTANLRIAGTN